MSAPNYRRRVTCSCGKTLMYLVGCDATTSGRTQIDCGRCQYLVWRLYRSRGEDMPKRALMVLHTIGHAVGAITGSEVLALDNGTMRQRPAADLRAAIEAATTDA